MEIQIFEKTIVSLQPFHMTKSYVGKIVAILLWQTMISACIVRLTGCETWTRQEGVASLGGTLYTSRSLSDCLNLCLEMSTCVAVDFSMVVCAVHANINDTSATFSAPDFTQYILNRACLPSALTSGSSTLSTTGTQTSTQSTYFGE